tara:strand:- start:36856 stop:37230 length:375 start_codon:yes stop_codon:yes gene_type:complete
MISDNNQYINLSTRKHDGSYVNTPVWFAKDNCSQKYYVYTKNTSGKVKRIKNYKDIKVAVCSFSGKVRGEWVTAKADLVYESERIDLAYSLLRKKYKLQFFLGDCLAWLFGNYKSRQIICIYIK